jgi:hypothetical protein
MLSVRSAVIWRLPAKQETPRLHGVHFGDVEMKIANRVGLELAFRRGFAFAAKLPPPLKNGTPTTMAIKRRGTAHEPLPLLVWWV